jgi:hypothetical protein
MMPADFVGVLDVELQRLHAGVGGGGFVQRLPAPPGDDDLVAQFMQLFG